MEAEQDMTEEAEVVREESLPTLCRSRLTPNIPWWWELVGRRQSLRNPDPTDLLEIIRSLARLRRLVERGDIMAMRALRQPPRVAREEDKGLMKEDLEWELSGREIREDIMLTIVPAVAEAELEQ